MKPLKAISQAVWLLGLVLTIGTTTIGQEIGAAEAVRPSVKQDWSINVAFSEVPTNGIKEIHLENVIDSQRINLSPTASVGFVYSYKPAQPLEMKINTKT